MGETRSWKPAAGMVLNMRVRPKVWQMHECHNFWEKLSVKCCARSDEAQTEIWLGGKKSSPSLEMQEGFCGKML